MSITLSAEEAFKERVSKAEYQFVEKEIRDHICHGTCWCWALSGINAIIRTHLLKIKWNLQEEPSYEWKKHIWIDGLDLHDFFTDIEALDVKDRLNKFLSDTDIKKRYHAIFSDFFDSAMDFEKDEKEGKTWRNDDEEKVQQWERDKYACDEDPEEDGDLPDIPSKEDFYRMTHKGADDLTDEEIDELLSDDDEDDTIDDILNKNKEGK